jgi:dolichyl-phosphate-mannose--protein O-mannosyl transferase
VSSEPRTDTAVAVIDPDRPAPTGPGLGSTVAGTMRRRLATVDTNATSWFATGVVVFIAAVLRLIGLSHPPGKIFDEVYYANEAQGLLQHGVEWDFEHNSAKYVVHPPLGKWCIAVGEYLFGNDEFGWRISAAVAGVISVLLVIRIARRMFGSTVLSCAAGLLVSLDGLHFVLSRVALLDIFLTMFILAAFGCLLRDRDFHRERWLSALATGLDPSAPGAAGRPRLGVPWWRLAAAFFLGCAGAVKWSAAFYAIAFALLVFAWDVGLRRAVGARHPWRRALLEQARWLTAAAAIAAAVYLLSWTGWFLSDDGWNRHGLASQGKPELPVIGALQNLWQYHHDAFTFHEGLQAKHTYQSWPWQWLLMGRPVAFYWSSNGPCGASQCASEVLLLGTPLLWWSFIAALAGLAWFGIARRDWRAAGIATGIAAGILPWFYYEVHDSRTMFVFYALPAEPFLVLAAVYVLGAIIGTVPSRVGRVGFGGHVGRVGGAGPDRRMIGALVAGAYVLLMAACFAYFYPIYTGHTVPYADWWARMWLGNRWV